MPNTTVYTNNQYYQNIAAAIRSKNGQSTLYKPSEMGPAINALVVSGESVRLQTKTVDPITTQQNIIADAGYHGLSAVTIGAIQTETKTITENGTYTPIANHFFSNIVVNVTGNNLPDGDLLAYGSAPKQTIWEGTFTGEEQTFDGNTIYYYEAQDIQNAELLMNTDEVTVTFDEVQYTLQVVTIAGSGVGFGAFSPLFEDYPFAFGYGIENEEEYIDITTKTAGPHTLKVEGNPVEPTAEVLYENTFSGTSLNTADVQNLWKITEMQAVKATFDGTSYILNVDRDEEWDMWSLGDSALVDCPFFLMISEITDTDTETAETSYEMTLETGTSGEHTIKIETTDETVENPGGGSAIDLPGGEIVL